MTNYNPDVALFVKYGELSRFAISDEFLGVGVICRHNWRFIAGGGV